MNCDCLERIKKRAKEENLFKVKGEVEKVEVLQAAFIMNDKKMSHATYTEFEIKSTAFKSARKHKILHTFCPFCGTKIAKKKEGESDV